MSTLLKMYVVCRILLKFVPMLENVCLCGRVWGRPIITGGVLTIFRPPPHDEMLAQLCS